MKTHLLKYVAIFLIFIGFNATAQQTRYIDDIFDSVTVTSDVVYGQNVTVLPLLQGLPPAVEPLLFDIYEPKNDTLSERPVIILLHTGSFLPPVLNGQPTGSKTDNSIVENCTRWAKKGYVAVAMTYRQGWNPTGDQVTRTSSILQAAYRGIHDTKAMVRHLRKTADVDGNPYGIDESKIVVGGQGTGAYLSMGYATLDTVSELLIYPKFWDTTDSIPTNHTPYVAPVMPGSDSNLVYGFGNLDGTDTTYFPKELLPFPSPVDIMWNIGNNPSYSNDINMIFNLGGTLADLDWLDGNQVPHVSFHCENDPFAAIDEGIIIVPTTGDMVIPDVIGSRIANHYNTIWGNNNEFNQAGLNDTLSQMANSYNSNWNHPLNDGSVQYDGLYVFNTPAPSASPNAFGQMPYHESSPWDWWDLTTYGIMAEAVNGIPGQTSPAFWEANSLLGAPNSGSDSIPMLYLDTIHNYLNPRMYEVLNLGASTGIDMDEIIEKTTQVYPNPAKDNINIVSYAELINSVEVYNLSGQKVLSKKVNNGTTTKLNTSGLSKGVYIVDVKSRISSVKKKIIIE